MTYIHNMNISHKSTQGRRQRERVARRETILEAARSVFFSKGMMAATIDEIAEKCGLAKGTLYLYFKSKEEIYLSLMDEGTTLLKKEIEKVEELQLPSDKLLEAFLKTYYRFYQKHKDYFRIIFLGSHPDMQSNVSKELLLKCKKNGEGGLVTIRNVINRGIQTGLFRKVDAWDVANILWVTVNGIVMVYERNAGNRKAGSREVERALRTCLNLFLEGLKTERSRTERSGQPEPSGVNKP